jgi:beta-phosphoglucomutase family hydrolase
MVMGEVQSDVDAVTAGRPVSNSNAFVFDMDGTLVDNMGFHNQAWLAMFAELGINVDDRRLKGLMDSHTTPKLLRKVLGQQLSDARIVELSERKEAIYRSTYAPHLKPVQGLQPFLQEVQRLGIPMGVATSAGARNIDFTLRGLGIQDFFSAIVGGDDVPQGKRGPEIYLAAARRLGVRPEQCLVFEDSRSGIEAAQRAGMRIIVLATHPAAEGFRSSPGVLDLVKDFCTLEPAALLSLGSL